MTPSDYELMHFLFICNVTAWAIAGASLLLAIGAWRRASKPGKRHTKKHAKRLKALEDDLDALEGELDDHSHRAPGTAGLWATYTWTAPTKETEERLAALEAWRAQWAANAEVAKGKLDAAEARGWLDKEVPGWRDAAEEKGGE